MQFNGRLLEVPDNDIIYYDSLGNFRKLNPIRTNRGYYGFKPDDKDLFVEVVDGTFKCWYNKKHCRIEDGCIKFDRRFIYRIKNNKMVDSFETNFPKSFYENKSICLIGSGEFDSSIIKKEDYDYIVGVNRIYLTDIFNIVDILYHGLSRHDLDFFENINNISNKKLVVIPGIKVGCTNKINRLKNSGLEFYHNTNIYWYLRSEMKSPPLSGIITLSHILSQNPLKIDIFGFNFYKSPYISGIKILENHPNISNSHNIETNEKFFIKMLNENKNINWII